jgi:hypothetical protein
VRTEYSTTQKEEDMIIPFFKTVDDAEQFLENQADHMARNATKA